MTSESVWPRVFAALIAVVAFGYFVYLAGDILLPFFFAGVVAYLLNPVIAFFVQRGLRRDRLVIAMYLAVAALLFLAAQTVVPMVSEFFAAQQGRVAEYQMTLKRLPGEAQKTLVKNLPIGGEQAAAVVRGLEPKIVALAADLPELILLRLPVLFELALIPFVTYFALVQGPSLIQEFVEVCPNRHLEKALSLLGKIDEALGNYLRGMFLEAVAVGAVTWLGLLFLGVHYAWQIGLATGVANVVPYLGPICGGVLGASVAYAQFHTLGAAGDVLLLAAAVRLLDDSVFQPTIMHRAVELHPVVILFALLLGGSLFGILGLLFAVPVACILKEAGVVLYDWYVAETGQRKTSFTRHALRIPYL